jgi:hypothetical protein
VQRGWYECACHDFPIHNSISIRIQTWASILLLEHLQQCSAYDPALKILDEVQQSNPVDSLEDCGDTGKMHSFLEKYSQFIFIHCSLFLIGKIVRLVWMGCY